MSGLKVPVPPDHVAEVALPPILPARVTLGVVSQIVTGNLNDAEKTMLAYMLRKLEHFHNDIFINKKDNELEELIK